MLKCFVPPPTPVNQYRSDAFLGKTESVDHAVLNHMLQSGNLPLYVHRNDLSLQTGCLMAPTPPSAPLPSSFNFARLTIQFWCFSLQMPYVLYLKGTNIHQRVGDCSPSGAAGAARGGVYCSRGRHHKSNSSAPAAHQRILQNESNYTRVRVCACTHTSQTWMV